MSCFIKRMGIFCLLFMCYQITNAQLEGNWYRFDSNGKEYKTIISKERIWRAYRASDDASWKPYDSILLHKITPEAYIVKKDIKGTSFSGGSYLITRNGQVLQLAQIPHSFKTPKSVLDSIQTTPYEILFQRDFYNKKYKEEIKSYTALDQITKTDFAKVLAILEDAEPLVEQFLENGTKQRQRMLSYIIKELTNRAYIDLGYNPYKKYEGMSFLERMAKDEELRFRMDNLGYLKLHY